MKISKKIVSLLTITFLTVTLCGSTSNASTKDTLTGSGRWETAIKISQAGWTKSESAVIVNDNSIVDALSATPLAKAKDAPILLTQSNKLDSRTKAELKRLGVKNVYLIGGSIALSSNIEKQLNEENIDFERISGDSRYDTSLKLAEKLDKEKSISKIVVVNGENGLADAVSVGAIAAQENMPIILSDSNDGIGVANNFIKDKNIEKTYIIGGTNSISNSIEKKLPNTKRISGSNRNETNSRVIEEFYKKTNLKNAYITKDGVRKQSDLIDSLAVGVLAAKNNSPIILAGSKIDSTQKQVLNTKIINKIIQVGGMGNENVVEEIMNIQEQTKYIVETVEELNVAIKKADANDIITFKPEKRITDSFSIDTNKSISIEFEGQYSQSITMNIPNGEINNIGDISGDVIVKDIKDGTFKNSGSISNMDIYDENGCRIENEEKGEIWLLTIISGAKDVYIKNDGNIARILNDSSSVTIKNSGDINTVNGSEEPIISGNRPKINNTEKDDNNMASGIYPTVKPCTPNENNYVMFSIPQKPKNSDYKFYYRVVTYKPYSIEEGTKVNLNNWVLTEHTNPIIIKAKNGCYVEVIEINTSNKRVSRWGKSDITNDGINSNLEVASGLKANVSFDGTYVKISNITSSNIGCTIYYKFVSTISNAMYVGDSVNLSGWTEVKGSSFDIKDSNLKGKYIELVELDDLTNKVTRWGISNII